MKLNSWPLWTLFRRRRRTSLTNTQFASRIDEYQPDLFLKTFIIITFGDGIVSEWCKANFMFTVPCIASLYLINVQRDSIICSLYFILLHIVASRWTFINIVQGKIRNVVLCVIARTFQYMVTEGSEQRTTSIQFITPDSHALKCKHGRYTVYCSFWYFLSTSGSSYIG